MINKKGSIALVVPYGKDYDCLELSLACHSKFSIEDAVIFFVQVCFDDYESKRSRALIESYQKLYPHRMEVLDSQRAESSELILKNYFNLDLFKDFDFVAICNERLLILQPHWLQGLKESFIKHESDNLAYITPFINNNPATLRLTLDLMELTEEYFEKVAHDHLVGLSENFSYAPYRVLPKDIICLDGYGTLYNCPHISYWLHEKSSFAFDKLLHRCKEAGVRNIDNHKLYFADLLLSRVSFFKDILSSDEEFDMNVRLQRYCLKNGSHIVLDTSCVAINMFYDNQRVVNGGLIKGFQKLVLSKLGNVPLSYTIKYDEIARLGDRVKYFESILVSHQMLNQIEQNSHQEPCKDRSIVDWIRKHLDRESILYRMLRFCYHQLPKRNI